MAEDEATASKFRRLVELREKRDSTKLAAEKASKEYREYERELWDELDESPIEGTRRINLGAPGTIRFTPRETKYGRIIDRDAAIKWFEENGRQEVMLRSEINEARLNELVRERLEQGLPMPPGVDWYARRGITIARPKDAPSLDV